MFDAFINWVESSKYGIYVAGAIGSILGFLVLRIGYLICRLIWRRVLLRLCRNAAFRVLVAFVNFVRGNLARRALIDILALDRNSNQFALMCIQLHVYLVGSVLIFHITVLATVIFVAVAGGSHPWMSAFLISLSLLALYVFLYDAVFAFRAHKKMFGETESKLEKYFADDGNVGRALNEELSAEDVLREIESEGKSHTAQKDGQKRIERGDEKV